MYLLDKNLLPDAVVKPALEPKIGSLQHIIAWLGSKPADGVYCYSSFGDCLFFHFGRDHGGIGADAYGHGLGLVGRGGDGIAITNRPRGASGTLASAQPWTFGAALERARALQVPE